MFMILFTIVISALLGVKVALFLLNQLWQMLTPGQKWLELAAIISSVAVFIGLYIITNKIEKQIDDTFMKLKKEITNKDAIIAKKEETISKLEDIIKKNEQEKAVDINLIECCSNVI